MIGNKPPNQTTVVVAMSGGVDSSTVAAMLKHQNYNVIGITLQLYDQGKMLARKGACCAGQDIYDAKMVADKLGIPHYVLDYESKFKEAVIDDFVESYINGYTPLPCVRCNQSVKFQDLLKFAKNLDADALATGHYVQRTIGKNGPELHKGIDNTKDQSYFLFTTTKDQLDFTYFPLGSMSKNETRKKAEDFGLAVSGKADSQDICFVPNGKYAELVAKLRPAAIRKGQILHIDGYPIGDHEGVINYTIGQRRGIGVALGKPMYVVKIDAQRNIVYVGEEHHLDKTSFYISNVNWLADSAQDYANKELTVKIRSTHIGALAKISQLANGKMRVELLEAEKAITPGQACVVYDGSRVLGGGWIEKE